MRGKNSITYIKIFYSCYEKNVVVKYFNQHNIVIEPLFSIIKRFNFMILQINTSRMSLNTLKLTFMMVKLFFGFKK